MYPKVFADYKVFKEEYGDVSGLGTREFLVGPELGEECIVEIEEGKTISVKVLAISDLLPNGNRELFCEMNGQLRSIFVTDTKASKVSKYQV